MSILSALAKTGKMAATVTKTVLPEDLRSEIKSRVGLRASIGYATNNSKFGDAIATGIGKGYDTLKQTIKNRGNGVEVTPPDTDVLKDDEYTPEKPHNNTEKPVSQQNNTVVKDDVVNASQALESGENVGGNNDDRVFRKLVDIDNSIGRLSHTTEKELKHTSTIIKDTVQEQQKAEKTENSGKPKVRVKLKRPIHSSDNIQHETLQKPQVKVNWKVPPENDSSKSDTLIPHTPPLKKKITEDIKESFETDKDNARADEQFKTITKISDTLTKISMQGLKVIIQNDEGKGGLGDTLKNKLGFGSNSNKKGGGRIGRAKENALKRVEKLKGSLRNSQNHIRDTGQTMKNITKNATSRVGSMAKSGVNSAKSASSHAARGTANLASRGVGAVGNLARGSLGLAGSGTAAASGGGMAGAGLGAAALSALVFGGTGLYSGYKAVKGEDASNWISNLTDKGYQKITGRESSMSSDIYDLYNDEQGNNRAAKFVKDSYAKVKKTIIGDDTKETESESFGKSFIQNKDTNLPPLLEVSPSVKSPIPDIMPVVNEDVKKEKAIIENQLNPAPVVVSSPQQTRQIEGGGRGGGEQAPVIARPTDSSLRRLSESFIFASLS